MKVGFLLFAYVFSFVGAILLDIRQWCIFITDTGITHKDFCAVKDFRTGELESTEFARAQSCRASTANAGTKLEIKEEAECCPEREHSAICYEPEESRLIIFGGWANRWLNDVWRINVSSIVGPPYATISVEPGLGPVTGNMKVVIKGIGFQDTQGVAVIQFSNDRQSVECQGEIVCDERIHCATPRPIQVVGMSAWDREVRVSIGLEEYTTTKTAYSYFLNTIAEVANFLKDPEVNREIGEDVLNSLCRAVAARVKDFDAHDPGDPLWGIAATN